MGNSSGAIMGMLGAGSTAAVAMLESALGLYCVSEAHSNAVQIEVAGMRDRVQQDVDQERWKAGDWAV